MFVAALYNNKWHRAEIIKLPGRANVEIFLLDVGETGVVPWNKIRRLQDDFIVLEAQVYIIIYLICGP